MGSKLVVTDNSGVKYVKCIKVLGGSKKKIAKIGDKIVVSIKKTLKASKIKIGTIYHAIVVRTKSLHKRKNGTTIKFFENAIVLIDKNTQIIGTRIFGPIPVEIKKKKILKITSLAQEII